MSTRYTVIVEEFAEKYYLKNFRKRHKVVFEAPWKAFVFMLQSFDLMLEKGRTNPISDPSNDIVICKCEFKILPKESARSSGNRCIVSQNKDKKEIRVLLVYSKNDVQKGKETVWWKAMVAKNYPEYGDLL